jgi:hypothetical protein
MHHSRSLGHQTQAPCVACLMCVMWGVQKTARMRQKALQVEALTLAAYAFIQTFTPVGQWQQPPNCR